MVGKKRKIFAREGERRKRIVHQNDVLNTMPKTSGKGEECSGKTGFHSPPRGPKAALSRDT